LEALKALLRLEPGPQPIRICALGEIIRDEKDNVFCPKGEKSGDFDRYIIKVKISAFKSKNGVNFEVRP
jgi:hypothetical protein